MARISEEPVSKHVLEHIAELLIYEIARIRTDVSAQAFLESFFTPTERIMFAKRFAIIVMLEEGWPYSEIERVLKVSPSTIGRLQQKRERGVYNALLYSGAKKKSRSAGFTLEAILRGGLPPITGKGRWKTSFAIIDDQRQREVRKQRRKRLPRRGTGSDKNGHYYD